MDYVLEPQAAKLLELAAASGRPELYDLSPADARRQMLETGKPLAGEPRPIGRVVDRSIPGPAGDIPIRLYSPTTAPADLLPVLVYFHGGGFVIGDLESHDCICRWFCEKAGCLVVSVGYRLAPEHRFPAAVDDAYAATAWVAAEAEALGGDPARIAVGGDSAGGTLATVVCHLARDNAGPAIRYQLLLYPATDWTCAQPSHSSLAEGYRLTRRLIDWFAAHYMPNPADRSDPRASPLFAADCAGLPAALIVTAGFDPLRDEGAAYGEKLRAAGIAAEAVCYGGMVHGFMGLPGFFDTARVALDHAAGALRRALQ